MIPSKLRIRKIAIITINILKIILRVPANAIKIQKEKKNYGDIKIERKE